MRILATKKKERPPHAALTFAKRTRWRKLKRRIIRGCCCARYSSFHEFERRSARDTTPRYNLYYQPRIYTTVTPPPALSSLDLFIIIIWKLTRARLIPIDKLRFNNINSKKLSRGQSEMDLNGESLLRYLMLRRQAMIFLSYHWQEIDFIEIVADGDMSYIISREFSSFSCSPKYKRHVALTRSRHRGFNGNAVDTFYSFILSIPLPPPQRTHCRLYWYLYEFVKMSRKIQWKKEGDAIHYIRFALRMH